MLGVQTKGDPQATRHEDEDRNQEIRTRVGVCAEKTGMLRLSTTSPAETAVIGDIHGCGVELRELLEHLVESTSTRRLVPVGDLFTKGRTPHEVVRVLDEFERAGGEVHPTCGNHDLRMLVALTRVEAGMSIDRLPKTERRTFKRLEAHDCVGAAHRWLIRAADTVEWSDGRGMTVVHAGLQPQLGLSGTSDHDKIHLKAGENQRHWWQDYDGTDGLIVFGHKPVKQPLECHRGGNLVAINIDTGCADGGQLTAFLAGSHSCVSVESQQLILEQTRPKAASVA